MKYLAGCKYGKCPSYDRPFHVSSRAIPVSPCSFRIIFRRAAQPRAASPCPFRPRGRILLRPQVWKMTALWAVIFSPAQSSCDAVKPPRNGRRFRVPRYIPAKSSLSPAVCTLGSFLDAAAPGGVTGPQTVRGIERGDASPPVPFLSTSSYWPWTRCPSFPPRG